MYTHSVSHAHFSGTVSLRDVQTSRARMAQGVCSAHVTSLHLTLSILMLHPPSLLFPGGHFETTFPTSTSSTSLPNCSRPESAGQAHFHTSGEEVGCLVDPTHFAQFHQLTCKVTAGNRESPAAQRTGCVCVFHAPG